MRDREPPTPTTEGRGPCEGFIETIPRCLSDRAGA